MTENKDGQFVVTGEHLNDVTFNDWTEQACPERPPNPPGWDQWWSAHRKHVDRVIAQARVQMGQQIEYRVLKLLVRNGQRDHPLASEILACIEKAYRREIDLATNKLGAR